MFKSSAPSIHEGRLDAGGQPSHLQGWQIVALIGWGVLLWLIVALAIRVAPEKFFARGEWTMLLFAFALPNAWATVWTTRRLVRLTPGQIVPAAALASAAAMLCDGIALTWTTLYGPDTRDLVPAAALLLWGVATILIAALIITYRSPLPSSGKLSGS